MIQRLLGFLSPKREHAESSKTRAMIEPLEGRRMLSATPINLDPDDQISEAVPMEVGTSINGAISDSSDVDMFAVTVKARQTIQFDVDTAGAFNWPILRLFDSSGNEWARGMALGSHTRMAAYFDKAGTYYLGTSFFNNDSYDAITGDGDSGFSQVGVYSLRATAIPTPPGVTAASSVELAKARTLSAFFEKFDPLGRFVTDILVQVEQLQFRNSAGQFVDYSFVSVLIAQNDLFWNAQTEFAGGDAQSNEIRNIFVSDSLDSGTVDATVIVVDQTGGGSFNVDVNLAWTGAGTVHGSANTRTRAATASGTVFAHGGAAAGNLDIGTSIDATIGVIRAIGHEKGLINPLIRDVSDFTDLLK